MPQCVQFTVYERTIDGLIGKLAGRNAQQIFYFHGLQLHPEIGMRLGMVKEDRTGIEAIDKAPRQRTRLFIEPRLYWQAVAEIENNFHDPFGQYDLVLEIREAVRLPDTAKGLPKDGVLRKVEVVVHSLQKG